MVVPKLELWGGVECTVNRVRDEFFDQLKLTGHHSRIEDLDRLAALGIRAIRYPILWERCARTADAEDFDFAWADERMCRLKHLGIRVIVGLVHHGSGPSGTSLLDESFCFGLSRFARRVAERYPWIQDYTPVNEPLTTARFSALYGHWYPHAASTEAFLRALMIETRATALAMREIRKTNPDACLVQTEDFGSVFSTPGLQYQADFENQRKWLSLDLLYGRVTSEHPLYEFLLSYEVSGDELRKLECEPCAPDLIGVNYYVTSDRYLDEQISRYPEGCIGSNGRDRYADVEAVRVHPKGIVGHREVLLSAWSRYRTPLAVTEVHLGCTPEEQMRWLREAWNGACEARRAGADVRAVTLWSAFGSYDWDSLVTQARGHYEPGAFDVSAPEPARTALACIAGQLSQTGTCSDPLLDVPGWWRRSTRLSYRGSAATRTVCDTEQPPRGRPVLITGRGGMLAEAFRRACEERGIAAVSLGRSDLDVTDESAVRSTFVKLEPWLVVNAAGVSWSRAAADETDGCFRENVSAAGILAQQCQERGARFVTFSSAFVFRGDKRDPYVETDALDPVSALGRSQVSAERLVAEIYPGALVIRAGTLFGANAARNQVWSVLCELAMGVAVSLSRESYWSWAHAPEVAHRSLDLAIARESGVIHLAHSANVSVYDFIRSLAEAMGIAAHNLSATSREYCRFGARLPPRMTLSSRRTAPLSSLEKCLALLPRMTEVQAVHAA